MLDGIIDFNSIDAPLLANYTHACSYGLSMHILQFPRLAVTASTICL